MEQNLNCIHKECSYTANCQTTVERPNAFSIQDAPCHGRRAALYRRDLLCFSISPTFSLKPCLYHIERVDGGPGNDACNTTTYQDIKIGGKIVRCEMVRGKEPPAELIRRKVETVPYRISDASD